MVVADPDPDVTRWRVIYTDSESPSGFAPVCPHADDRTKHTPNEYGEAPDPGAVFDCCPHPHIECWDTGTAAVVAEMLTHTGAQYCS